MNTSNSDTTFNYRPYDRRPYSKKPGPVTREERVVAQWGYAQIKDEAPRIIARAVKHGWIGFHGMLGKEL